MRDSNIRHIAVRSPQQLPCRIVPRPDASREPLLPQHARPLFGDRRTIRVRHHWHLAIVLRWWWDRLSGLELRPWHNRSSIPRAVGDRLQTELVRDIAEEKQPAAAIRKQVQLDA